MSELNCRRFLPGPSRSKWNWAAATPRSSSNTPDRIRRKISSASSGCGRIQKLDKKGRRIGLTNTRGVRIESAYFLEFLLPPHSATALHVYFPDPWPKKKHRRHRLIGETFPALARQALAPGGAVFLRTDDADYFRQMNEVFGAAKEFEKSETPPALAEITTDFEREFNAQGIPTLRAAFQVLN